eukprot:152364-Amphidinium_carterae.1
MSRVVAGPRQRPCWDRWAGTPRGSVRATCGSEFQRSDVHSAEHGRAYQSGGSTADGSSPDVHDMFCCMYNTLSHM